MLKRRSNTQTLSWFTDQMSFKRLDLNPPYQRKSVWSPSYKRYFIDSILNNFPCPTIFVNADTDADGVTIYRVVDGKQRLTAIFEFIQEIFKTGRESDPLFADKYFSQLPPEIRKDFFDYTFTIETISGASAPVLNEAFDRLNRNVAKLTDQELRHAKFSGKFIALMEVLAGDPIWEKCGISTVANIRRMRDVEFISEIFLLTMYGIQEGGAEILDKYYSEYDEDIPNESMHRERYEWCKDTIISLKIDYKNSRFSNYADFYGLWAAIMGHFGQKINIDETSENLSDFASSVDWASRNEGEFPQEVLDYRDAVRQGSNKVVNRGVRAKILDKNIVVL